MPDIEREKYAKSTGITAANAAAYSVLSVADILATAAAENWEITKTMNALKIREVYLLEILALK